eukprot:COSAG05_NODE_32_length_28165_cov_450.666714_2_plen_104_part_00
MIELELSYEPLAPLRWHTLVSVDFPTRTGRRMHWILVLESGMVHDARIYSRSTYFASPPLPLPSIFYARRPPTSGPTTPTPTEPKTSSELPAITASTDTPSPN